MCSHNWEKCPKHIQCPTKCVLLVSIHVLERHLSCFLLVFSQGLIIIYFSSTCVCPSSGGVLLSKIIQSEARLFTRNIKVPGAGFEYAMFIKKSQEKCVCIFQAGHLLEGPPGWVKCGVFSPSLSKCPCSYIINKKIWTLYIFWT